MKKNTVTQEQIDHLFYSGQLDVKTVHGKTTVVSLKLPNGFVIVDSSSCVDQANYDEEMGTQICVERIKNKLWELEGYVLQKELFREKILARAEAEKAIFFGGKIAENPINDKYTIDAPTAAKFFNGEHFDSEHFNTDVSVSADQIKPPANEWRAFKRLEGRVEELRKARDIQSNDGNWNYDHYMHGFYNALELALSIMEGRDPQFKDAPVDWLHSKNAVEPPAARVDDELVYRLTHALNALDKDYDSEARGRIIIKMLQVLGL